VANHSSPVDPVILWIRHFAEFPDRHMRVIGFMMAREYYLRRDPVGWVCRAMRAIPVERAGRDFGPVRTALKRLQQGQLIALFPEGRLNETTPDQQLLPGGTGVAWLALKSGVPVLPVFIHNAPRGRTMVSSFFIRTRTSVTYGPPVDLSRWADGRLTHLMLAEATNEIMRSLAALGNVQYTPVTRVRAERIPDLADT
jgi:1-acyl-sn-glycerol-3-phosphate acyltransferase